MTKSQRRRILFASLIICIIIAIGTIGYVILEGYSFLEALYMTVITLSTVGYGEPKPLDSTGKVFTIILILCNLGVVGYTITLITTIFIQTDFVNLYRKKNMNKKIRLLRGHVIVCGYGRTGRESCATLARNHIIYVVVEKDESVINELK